MRLRNIQNNTDHNVVGTDDIYIDGVPAIVNGHVTDKFSIIPEKPVIDINKYNDVFFHGIRDRLMMVTEKELLDMSRSKLKGFVYSVHAGRYVNLHRADINIIRQLIVIRDKIIKLRHIEV